MYKKTRKKTKKAAASSSWILFAFWALCFSAAVWILLIQWFPVSGGAAGESVSRFLFERFGYAAKIMPLLFLYWLYRSVKEKTFSVFTFLLGMSISLCSVSGLLVFFKRVFSASNIEGGQIGRAIFLKMDGLVGGVGAAVFLLALLVVGLHILFAVKWLDTFHFLVGLVKEDYTRWINARAELKTKIKEADESDPVLAVDNEDEPEEAPRSKPEIRRPVAEIIKAPPVVSQAVSAPPAAAPIQTPVRERKINKDGFILPPLSLMSDPKNEGILGPTDEEIHAATVLLETTLKSFNIKATVTGVSPGPVVTRYEIKPDAGVKISSIVSISNDIALAMKARGIRVEAPIPGKDAIGFEIPNETPMMVTMKEILQDKVFVNSKAKMPIALGRYADGAAAGAALEKMPHLLIAGATNSGKSICLHTIVMSILFHSKPDEVKFLMIDPKRLELTFYEDIPHLYDPKVSCTDVNVVTDAQGAVKSLQALVKVMEKRYKIMELARVKNIEGYNVWAAQNGEEKMFYLVVIIDELADLMLQTRAAIEDSIQRLAQMARAVGIHLVLCTQRPSVNVITGVIKANLPSRIALQVTSKTDSRVILDSLGADQLLGKGDMLYQGISDQKPSRIQGAYVSEQEIAAVADFLREQGGPDYELPLYNEASPTAPGARPEDGLGTTSEELQQVLTLIKERRRVSQDLLKANFGSSAKATNILSVLEMKGYISKPEGTNRWEINYDLIDDKLAELGGSPKQDYDVIYK